MLTSSPLYFLAFLVLALSAFLVGKVLRNWIDLNIKNPMALEAIWIFFGHLVSIGLFALILTQGKTIFSLLILGSIGLWALRKGGKSKPDQSGTKGLKRSTIYIFLGAAGFSFILFHLKYSNLSDLSLLVPAPDYINYGNIADYLVRYGIESNLFQIDKSNPGAFPYHYLELWTSGLLAYFFVLPETYVLVMVVYPFHLFLLLLGLVSLLQHFSGFQGLSWYLLLPIVLIPSSGLFFGFLDGLLPIYGGSEIFAYKPLNYHKLIIIQAVLMFGVLAYLMDNKTLSLVFLMLIPILFISTLPAVLLFLGLLLSIKILKPGILSGLCFNFILASIGFLILIPLFYFLLGEKGLGGNVLDPERLFDLSTRINIVAGTLIRHAYLYFWVIPVIFLAWKSQGSHEIKSLFLFSLLILFPGLCCWAVLFFANNSVQLYSNIGTPLMAVLIQVSFISLLVKPEGQKIPIRILVGVFLAFGLGTAWLQWFSKPVKSICDQDYIKTLSSYSAELNPVGAYIKAVSDYTDHASKNSTFSVQGRQLGLLDGKFYPVSLSVHATPLSSPLQKHLIENTVFYRFSGEDIPRSQYDFVLEYDVDYLFLSKDAEMPSSLDSIFSLKATNECSGERFYLRDQAFKKD